VFLVIIGRAVSLLEFGLFCLGLVEVTEQKLLARRSIERIDQVGITQIGEEITSVAAATAYIL
jgi:hypothetical protein